MTGVSLMLARDRDSGEPVGFSLFRTVADEAELLLIAVLPSITGAASAAAARAFLERGASRRDAAGSISKSATAIRRSTMYRTAGFAPVGRRRNYYHGADGRRFDAITLALQL